MIIDCHVHLNNYHEGQKHPTEENCRLLFEKMDERNVDHAVVITSYTVSDDRPSVENVLEILHDNPRTTIVEGLRWRGKERTDLFALEERVHDGKVAGIKLYPGYEPYAINDPSLESVFQMAAKHRFPVMIHTGDTYSRAAKLRYAHPLLVDDLAVDYPDVTFVMCHVGNPWFRDAAQVLYKNDNVYADISGLTLGQFSSDFEKYVLQQLREMIWYMGDPSRQLMYGSDWPLVRMAPYIDFMESLALEPEQMEALRWKTAARLFKIDLKPRTQETVTADETTA
jgi:predicted TIM-barrel fold metal-dependent hydrolase